jgi:hypothetical protein
MVFLSALAVATLVCFLLNNLAPLPGIIAICTVGFSFVCRWKGEATHWSWSNKWKP